MSERWRTIELPLPEPLDFTVLRRVPIERVLASRGLLASMRRQRHRLTGPCPIHGGDNPTAFVVDRAKNVWYCFTGCSAGGDVIALVERLDHVSARAAAGALASMAPAAVPEPTRAPERVFVPFTSTLYLEPAHPWLAAKGIGPDVARAYEVGAWGGRGLLTGRMGVRLRTPTGAPMGYAGRLLEGEGSKWLFPPRFPKSEMLYGHHHLDPRARHIVVVECPWGVLRLAQLGIPAVALLGTSISRSQAELLTRRERVTLMFDGDVAGRRGTRETAQKLEFGVDVVIATLPAGADPDDLHDEELARIIR